MAASPIERYSLWGQLFEIAVKRGVLTALLGSQVSNVDKLDDLGLEPWSALSAIDVYVALAKELGEVDPNLKIRTRETARHLFELGMGLGQTAIREYLVKLKYHTESYAIKALWCPLQLPVSQGASNEDTFHKESQHALLEFLKAFGQEGQVDNTLIKKGQPVRADFLLWLEPNHIKIDRELLCLEFSLNGLPETADYTNPEAHLDELRRFAWFINSRSVFSRVCAEVSGETFALSPRIKDYLPAFTIQDKPLYKLCQAASYVERTLHWLKSRGFDDRPFNARALSITQNGFESLCARFFIGDQNDPRAELINNLGDAYRNCKNIPDNDEGGLDGYIRYAFDGIRKSLPSVISKQFRDMPELPGLGSSLAFDFSEDVDGFFNPMTMTTLDEALSMVGSDTAVAHFLKSEPELALANALSQLEKTDQGVSLRDLHAAAVVAGMQTSALGKMTVLGLEGNPGIGKTTAVVSYLKTSKEGFLFLYISPRVIINDDVTGSLARNKSTNEATGILTLTTNSKLIGAAVSLHEKQAQGTTNKQVIDSAVVVDGVNNLKFSESSTMILTPPEKEALEKMHIGSSNRKRAETERQDRMESVNQPGVLRVLSNITRTLLSENPAINKVVLTAAIQGYREFGAGKNTLSALDNIFKNPVNSHAGKQERQSFANRIQTIVVMVDELTGDGAGAPLIHAVADWLNKQLIKPFESAPIFRVILIISDASLGNEVVLDRYLNSGIRAPDKVMVSGSMGKRPFRLAATSIKINKKQTPVLHVMTNSYPASKLTIDYRVRLDLVKPEEKSDGKMQTMRQAIAAQMGEAVKRNIIKEITRGIESGADQVIFFAQDKILLRQIKTELTASEDNEMLLAVHQVEIIDSSVLPTKRKELITDEKRDGVKVFLMTSSAARGVSFPKTDWIIALIPRFNIEAALMEIAQLIYRGRGTNYTADNGELRHNGDWKDRRLVMLLQDFLPEGDEQDLRQWLRQVSDLLTYMVMLRSTIYTRITGDAGLDKQSLAMVPVGRIGTEEMLSLMSTHVRTFLAESDVLLNGDSTTREQKGLIADAQEMVKVMFSKFSLDATAKSRDLKSVVRIEDIQRFSKLASADNTPLLILPKNDPDGLIPGHLYCIGPFWLEHWKDMDKQERFNVEGWLADVGPQIPKLLGELNFISNDHGLPDKLRKPAEELHKILIRKKAELTREFSTVKALNSPSTWIAVPLDYARFWKKDDNGQMPSLGDEVSWRDALGACLGSREILPVVPRYADFPYAAVIGEQDPSRLNLVFDDRYLGASNELNLLNTILLS
jgi:hypothetical protein